MAKNVLGTDLKPCCLDPVTGYYRNGKCDTGQGDHGMHTICAVMSKEFLAFSKQAGNDLSSPVPEMDFPGLTAGDQWCLCLPRWIEAHEAGMAPSIVLEATHVSVLEYVSKHTLEEHSAG